MSAPVSLITASAVVTALAVKIRTIDACEIYTAHLEQLLAQIELRRVPGASVFLALFQRSVVCLQSAQLCLDLPVALGHLSTNEVEPSQCLLECKPRHSNNSNSGIQYTRVNSIATMSTWQAASQSASAWRSTVKLGDSRTA